MAVVLSTLSVRHVRVVTTLKVAPAAPFVFVALSSGTLAGELRVKGSHSTGQNLPHSVGERAIGLVRGWLVTSAYLVKASYV